MADPLRELLAFQEKVNRLFDNALIRSEFGGGPTALGQWTPPASVIEDGDSVIVEAELPGVREENIDIAITDHSVRITGESKMARDLQEASYLRIERSYGSFNFDFPLHAPIDRDHVEATFRRGVLQVVLPKRDAAGAQHVKVRLKSRPS